MKILKLVSIILLISISYILGKQPAQKNYQISIIDMAKNKALVDNFDTGINDNYWNIVERGNNYNNELQYYNPDNISFNNGYLEIEARKETFKDHGYTSGLINTKNKFEFLYGRIIVRAKPAVGQGLLSAIWLLPTEEPLLPEIDIIEVLGSSSNDVWTGIHYQENEGDMKSDFVTTKVNDDFSIYELVWEKKEIRAYIDNKLVFKTNSGIPDRKMYLIINLAVGGDWPKNPNDNDLPAKFLIDYVVVIP